MKILAIGQVENKDYETEILKQTLQPDRVVMLLDDKPARGIDNRRRRIVENHKKLQDIVRAYDCDLVWQIESDSVLPRNALKSLVKHFETLNNDDFGYVSGVQIGRHGIYAIGAWHVSENEFHSVDYRAKGVVEVDATGFYCLLAKKEVWLAGVASWNHERYGPDVVWGLSIDKKKYVDMDLKIGHRTRTGVIDFDNRNLCNVSFHKEQNQWKYETSQ